MVSEARRIEDQHSVRSALLSQIDMYQNAFGASDATAAFRVFASRYDNVTSRTNLTGHATGSALVHDRTNGKVLRVHHAKLDVWVFSAGGHMDDGEVPWQTAARELREETGIADACLVWDGAGDPLPLIVDAHPIRAYAKRNEPAHWHYDFVYLFEVDHTPTLTIDDYEIADFRWVAVDDVTRANAPVDLKDQLACYAQANRQL